MRGLPIATAVLVLLGVARIAHAQEAWLSASAAGATNERFSSPIGVAGGLTLAMRDRMAFRVSYGLLDDTNSRIGRACGGLLPPPPACPEEPIDDATSMRGVTLALLTDLWQRGTATFTFVPAVSALSIRSVARGRQTGERFVSSDPMLGFSAGGELTYRPNSAWPLSLHAGVHYSLVSALNDGASDAAPLTEQLHLVRLDLGLSVGRRERP